jgi:hypothetical protein
VGLAGAGRHGWTVAAEGNARRNFVGASRSVNGAWL